MDKNADFTQRALVHSRQTAWQPSPMPGVDRRPLDRLGDEVARATSIVRYTPGSTFSAHTHTGGEEFFVLEGVFQDEHGDYPTGTYVRNPPGTSHRPSAKDGTIIFVKLWQFDLSDRISVRINTQTEPFKPDSSRSGVETMPLFEDQRETVRLERWQPGTSVSLMACGGLELLVLEGSLSQGGDTLEKQSWLRLPVHMDLEAISGPEGAVIWLKEGHLNHYTHAPNNA